MFNRRNLIKSSLLVPFVGVGTASGVTSHFPDMPPEDNNGKIDITEGVRYFLSDEMKSVFDSLPKMTNLTIEDNGKFYIVDCVGYRHSDIKTGCAYLANKITEMHKQNPLKGILGVPAALKKILVVPAALKNSPLFDDGKDGKYTMFVYVANRSHYLKF